MVVAVPSYMVIVLGVGVRLQPECFDACFHGGGKGSRVHMSFRPDAVVG